MPGSRRIVQFGRQRLALGDRARVDVEEVLGASFLVGARRDADDLAAHANRTDTHALVLVPVVAFG
jgi:hypothetical protein